MPNFVNAENGLDGFLIRAHCPPMDRRTFLTTSASAAAGLATGALDGAPAPIDPARGTKVGTSMSFDVSQADSKTKAFLGASRYQVAINRKAG